MNRPLIITLVVIVMMFISLLFFFVNNQIKESSAFKKSIEFIISNESIQDQIGQYQGHGFFVSGNMEESSDSGFASFDFSLDGVKSFVDIEIMLKKDSKGWEVIDYEVY